MPIRTDPSTWRDPRQVRGLEGERRVIRYLEARGFAVLEHRFRLGRLEIDIIARRGSLVAFVEVKTRWSAAFGTGVEAVGWRKQREIVRVAQAWADRYGRPGDLYRFDVAAVSKRRSGGLSVTLVPDAFRPGWR